MNWGHNFEMVTESAKCARFFRGGGFGGVAQDAEQPPALPPVAIPGTGGDPDSVEADVLDLAVPGFQCSHSTTPVLAVGMVDVVTPGFSIMWVPLKTGRKHARMPVEGARDLELLKEKGGWGSGADSPASQHRMDRQPWRC